MTTSAQEARGRAPGEPRAEREAERGARGRAPGEPRAEREARGRAPGEPRAEPKAEREARRQEIMERKIFYRWVWLVYAPLPLGFLATVVFLSGILPGILTLPYLVLLAWDAFSIRLIVERRRRKMALRVPRTLPIGLGVAGGAVLIGFIFIWMGVDRLSSQAGPALMVLGGFLILTAVFAPAMKVVDLTLRLAARSLLRIPAHTDRRPASARRKPANPEQGQGQAA